MSALRNTRKPDDGSVDVLADVTRRRIVRIVHGRTEALSERGLAEHLATTDSSPESVDVADGTVRSSRIRLRHVHLPKLADVGLVEWDRVARTVEATEGSRYAVRGFGTSTPVDARQVAEPSPGTDRRREVLAIVESADGAVTRERVARELASREANGRPTEARIGEVTVRLHHRHIPKLREAGLVEYDPDVGTVKRA